MPTLTTKLEILLAAARDAGDMIRVRRCLRALRFVGAA